MEGNPYRRRRCRSDDDQKSISAAKAVMEKSEHVMMVGNEEFAKQVGLTIVDPSYFWTEARWESFAESEQG
jgi:beta-aspartyl-peptidase (threonine type)